MIFTSEAVKFASASLESFETFERRWESGEDREGLAWRLIGLYYAAFYGAHAISRFLGVSLTNVATWKNVNSHFNLLYKTDEVPSLGIRTGYHLMTLSGDKRAIEVNDANASKSLGSHGVTWREFRDLVDSVYANNSLNTTHQRRAVEDYVNVIGKSPGGVASHQQWSWLSVYRNDINYKLLEDIWGKKNKRLPPSKAKLIHKIIKSPTDTLIINHSKDENEVIRFVASCGYIVSVLCCLLREMEQRSTSETFVPDVVIDRRRLIDKFSPPK
ncbi:hypothetical protein AAFN60_02255 [Roseibacillus persicicus]|uniref:hypothetical protein n=1 Tax=Roseibacillus persicicus TaxID=454148 RepID=UPI00398ACCAD